MMGGGVLDIVRLYVRGGGARQYVRGGVLDSVQGVVCEGGGARQYVRGGARQ